MNIISDFSDIARRMNRKPEKVVAIDNSAAAAVRTLQSLGYTHEDGAQMWKPPLGKPSAILQAYDQALRSGINGASYADVVKKWREQVSRMTVNYPTFPDRCQEIRQ